MLRVNDFIEHLSSSQTSPNPSLNHIRNVTIKCSNEHLYALKHNVKPYPIRHDYYAYNIINYYYFVEIRVQ